MIFLFLFKVLSVRTALSIQSHPDIPLAKQLHATQPQHYKDANHKPEMSVALTPFEAMCGFRPLREVRHHLSVYPELAEIVGEDVSARFLASNLDDKDDDSDANRALLKDIFSAFMRAPDDLVTPLLEKLTSRLGTTNTTSDATEVYSSRSTQEELQKVDALILRLHTDFPSDRGALCPLLLNYIELQPGEAFFMGANEPHAYIYGDCVECMALSDNTVRAGLTPKHKDIETLVEMLHYRSGGAPACHMLQPRHVDDCTVLYRPPAEVCSEFEVERSTVPAGSTYALPVYNCGSIAIVVSGNGKLSTTSGDTLTSSDAPTGSIFFIPASSEVRVESAPCANSECVVIYRAHVNLQFL